MLDDIGYMYMYHLLGAISNWITSPFQGLARFKAREFHGLLVGPPMRASLVSDTKIGESTQKRELSNSKRDFPWYVLFLIYQWHVQSLQPMQNLQS
jgi:hypothetical protein